ncbi:MAG: hypothetical protein JO189_12425, partial [Deltaproteobacteria bacterium]|nr:hypothetical protein [Deltaproteobacteria bacterium]
MDRELRKIYGFLRSLAFPALLVCITVLRFCVRPKAAAPEAMPSVTGVVVGPKELVFDTRNGCEEIDIPDEPARAFRDYNGVVHLIATHFVAR